MKIKRFILSLLLLVLVPVLVTGCRKGNKTPDAPPPSDTATTSATSALANASWPQWRGPTGQGLAVEAQGLPGIWAPDSPNVVWKTGIPGLGNSSPIVAKGRVFLTTAEGGAEQLERKVLGLDLESGEILWQTTLWTAPRETKHRYNTSAAPTPAADDERVYAYFGAVLAALDFDGNVVWQKEVEANYLEFSRYAAVSSPIVVGDKIVLVQDQESGKDDDVGWFATFDKATGEELWRYTWDDTCCSYATPLQVGDRTFFAQSGALAEYDLEAGKPLFWHDVRINQHVASLVADGDMVCIAGGAHNVRNSSCVRLAEPGADPPLEVLWEDNRGAPETASPVLYNGLLYMVTEKGIMTCRNAETGEVLWRRRLTRGRGSYSVSLLIADNKLYVSSSRGLTTVFELVGEKIRLIGENHLGEGTNASLAVAGDHLVIRTKHDLFLIAKEPEGYVAPPFEVTEEEMAADKAAREADAQEAAQD